MNHCPFVLAVASCLVSLTAHAASEARVIWGGGISPGRCSFGDDAVTLVVSNEGAEIARLDYCSSYGQSSASVVTDSAGRSYVAVEYSEGRGTNATSEYLVVYRLIANDLTEVLRVPLSWATGRNARWTYEYQFAPSQSAGLQLTLRRSGSGPDECCALPEPTLALTIDAVQ